MSFLLQILALVVLLGVGIQQGWFEAVLGYMVEKVGLPTGLTLPAAADGAAEAAWSWLDTATSLVQGLPDPWRSIAVSILALICLGMILSVLKAIISIVIGALGWVRDISV
jgi:urea transporter